MREGEKVYCRASPGGMMELERISLGRLSKEVVRLET